MKLNYQICGQLCRLVSAHVAHDGEVFPQPRFKVECELLYSKY